MYYSAVYFIKYLRLKIAEAALIFLERRNFLVLKLLDHTTDQIYLLVSSSYFAALLW